MLLKLNDKLVYSIGINLEPIAKEINFTHNITVKRNRGIFEVRIIKLLTYYFDS